VAAENLDILAEISAAAASPARHQGLRERREPPLAKRLSAHAHKRADRKFDYTKAETERLSVGEAKRRASQFAAWLEALAADEREVLLSREALAREL
jgi:acyl-CoA synthetase (AMP-forming)/AMP-acid ligase II